MYVTIDEYYPIEFYNESKEALKNNKIEFQEFINVKPPYNWYIELDKEPIMINYEEISKSNIRWLISKVIPLKSNEEYLFHRRNDDKGKSALLKYVENKPMTEARKSDFAVFFNIRNKEEALYITKELPVKIYWLGKHYNNKFNVCLCTNKMILNYIDKSEILMEKTSSEPGIFEAELNFKIFRGNDMLKKYTETPYFYNGKYIPVNIKGARQSFSI